MKPKQFLKKLSLLFNQKHLEAEQRRQSLKAALKQLKEKHKALKAELEASSSEEERQQLAEKIGILETQRRKGIDKLRNPDD